LGQGINKPTFTGVRPMNELVHRGGRTLFLKLLEPES
jgi:hypothetical protein